MSVQSVFARAEIKYLITPEQRSLIEREMEGRMIPDEFGRSNIVSIYYDTPSRLLIRRSIESPRYKEKLRLRSYGTAKQGETVYAEIKKKYASIVYKRRIGMPLEEAKRLLAGDLSLAPDTQIGREIEFFIKRYGELEPAAFISSERQAYYAKDDHEFRVTFDEKVIGREYDLDLTSEIYGKELLPEGKLLMEVKAGGAIPLWLCRLLSEQKIFKAKFSKYGTLYQMNGLKSAKEVGVCSYSKEFSIPNLSM